MRKTLTKAVAVAGFALLVTIGATGQASAITSGQCVEGGGIVIDEMDGTRTCIGGFYTGLEILF
ncbi:hypothetical protein [Nocardia farcinica]|uniref:hypothetical protein n=1 Tax=Nocardia farcinica TaxID=37329 RepID=UPI00189490A9|nr:hypothetical protein [Nocardia farcinica]MBF6230131.1 hypothetical protein [Nocardia farcinica]